jgi:citrate lyase beta subunit
MTKPRRLWRAMLYVPANVPRFVEKAPKAGADAVVLDLEDSVPYDRKLARIIHQESADVVYSFGISYDFAAESQNPRIQRPHPPWWKLPHLCPACHLFLARR